MNKVQIKKAFKEYQKPDLSTLEEIRTAGYRFESVPYVIPSISTMSAKNREGEILDIDLSLEAGWIAVRINELHEGYNYVFIDIDDIRDEIIRFIEAKLNCKEGDLKIDNYVIEECTEIIANMFI